MENKELVQIDVSYVDKIAGDLTTESIEELETRCKALTIKGIDDKEGFKHVSEARKIVKKHISNVTAEHGAAKADVLKIGRMFDAEKRRLLELLTPIRDGLQEKESVIKQEKARLAAEKQRKKQEAHEEQIKELTQAGAVYDFSDKRFKYGSESFTDNDIWGFDEQNYNLLLSCVKQWKESEDLKKAEEERQQKERAAKQKAVEEENRKIREGLEQEKKEREEEKAKLREEREAFEKDKQDAIDKKEREEADKQAAIKIEEAKKQAAEEARLKAIEEAKLKAEADARETERLEKERINNEKLEKLRLAELEAQKPDREKLIKFFDDLKYPELTTEKYKKVLFTFKQEVQSLMNFLTAE